MLVICVAPFASARTGGPLREGVRNGTTTSETQVISNIASTTDRDRRLLDPAVQPLPLRRRRGLRLPLGGRRLGGDPRPQNPCIRANNLSTGFAFEFNASDGAMAGLITVGTGGDATKPFVTNATGVATGLNADRVDGLDAAGRSSLRRGSRPASTPTRSTART